MPKSSSTCRISLLLTQVLSRPASFYHLMFKGLGLLVIFSPNSKIFNLKCSSATWKFLFTVKVQSSKSKSQILSTRTRTRRWNWMKNTLQMRSVSTSSQLVPSRSQQPLQTKALKTQALWRREAKSFKWRSSRSWRPTRATPSSWSISSPKSKTCVLNSLLLSLWLVSAKLKLWSSSASSGETTKSRANSGILPEQFIELKNY